jgi:AraC-like DNA-binding protein
MMNDLSGEKQGVIVYSFLEQKETEKVGFLDQSALALQVSGQLRIETSNQNITMRRGDILLVRKYQLVKFTKTPIAGEGYEAIFIRFSEDVLRKIALEKQIEIQPGYSGKLTIPIPGSQLLRGYFQSLMSYAGKPQASVKSTLGILKMKEAVELLLHSMPELKSFFFDFSEPHKVDLEKFMLSNFRFNVPVEKFARLTGRSLAGFKRDFHKVFGVAPRQWLKDKRLTEARHLIENKNKKPSAIYLDLGFESLSHFSHAFKQKFGKAPREFL